MARRRALLLASAALAAVVVVVLLTRKPAATALNRIAQSDDIDVTGPAPKTGNSQRKTASQPLGSQAAKTLADFITAARNG